MRNYLLTFFLISGLFVSEAQNNTAVYLFDYKFDGNEIQLENPVLISQGNGYHNQPSFLKDGSGVLFASTRNGQTDVALYEIEYELLSWLTDTEGSEYSPVQSPKENQLSAVRLDTDGTQLLRTYAFEGKKKGVAVKHLKIGYYTWIDRNNIVAFVLGEPQTLRLINLKEKKNEIITHTIGRSIHSVPGTDLVSFIDNKSNIPKISTFDHKSREIKVLSNALKDSQDMVWLPDGTMLMGQGDKLFKFKPGVDVSWQITSSLYEFGLGGITRMAASPTENKIAIVVTVE